MMRKKTICLAVILTLVISMLMPVGAAQADDDLDVSFSAYFGQNDARTMFQMLNEFRSKEGRYEDSSCPLDYDYDLEKVAMQRAAEIVISFNTDHIRPDGKDYLQTLADYGFDTRPRYAMYGENILFGTDDSMKLDTAFEKLCEKDENRKVMLGYFTSVGIAHIKMEDKIDFWVQVFSDEGKNTSYTAPIEGFQTVNVKVLPSLVESLNVDYTSGTTSVAVGATTAVPVYTPRAKFIGSELNEELILSPLKFESADEYVKASNGMMTGLKQGTGTISASLLGRTFSYQISVTAGSGVPTPTQAPTSTPMPTQTPTTTPVSTQTPTATPEPTTATPTPTAGPSGKVSLKKGEKFEKDGIKYTVTASGKVEVSALTSKKVTELNVPATVTYSGVKYKVVKIGTGAFKGNKKLETVTLGKNIATIGKKAFYGCSALKNITFSGTSFKKIGSKAFTKINANAKVYVPSKKESAYKKLLKTGGLNSKIKILTSK
ncbi:MAG: leucine-rich repeat protein [Lachnospiraceae bacterium]|nr:leucine-rich repeat protein [Lachnospiraceae bacterium]